MSFQFSLKMSRCLPIPSYWFTTSNHMSSVLLQEKASLNWKLFYVKTEWNFKTVLKLYIFDDACRSGIAQPVEHLPHSRGMIDPGFKFPQMSACRNVEENGLAAMLATKKLAGLAPLVHIREYITHMPLPSVNKAGNLALKPRGDITRSPKTGVPVARNNDSCPPKI